MLDIKRGSSQFCKITATVTNSVNDLLTWLCDSMQKVS